MQLVEGVQGAPEVGNFILEDAAREGEDAVDRLREVEREGVVPRRAVGVDREGVGEDEEDGGGVVVEGGQAAVPVVEHAEEEGGVQ